MDKLLRNDDVISARDDLELLYCFKNFPVYMGTTHALPSEDLTCDMQWTISKGTGMIQLNPVLPLEIVYSHAHGSGCVGELWMRHHQALADFIAEYSPASILEIGGAHGILSSLYNVRNPDVSWTIIEPNPTPVKESKAHFIRGFFDDNFRMSEPIDMVVHSHVFEHVYQPVDFVRHISSFLGEGRHLVFSVPNMEQMLKNKYTNCLNFEHTFLLTDAYIEFLLTQNGFEVLERRPFLVDHSIFYSCIRNSRVVQKVLPDGLYSKNKSLYLDYISYHEDLVCELNSVLEATSSEKDIYLFGAHVFSQYLIAFGLKTDRIVAVLDNDMQKWGSRLYGTNLRVESPSVLKGSDSPVVILKAGVYNSEISNDIFENINNSTIFI